MYSVGHHVIRVCAHVPAGVHTTGKGGKSLLVNPAKPGEPSQTSNKQAGGSSLKSRLNGSSARSYLQYCDIHLKVTDYSKSKKKKIKSKDERKLAGAS